MNGLKNECVTSSGLSLWLSVKESTCSAEITGDAGLIPGLGRSPAGRHGSPLQYSCLENQRSLGSYSPRGHQESDTTERLSTHTHMTSRTGSREHTLGDLRKLQE